MLGKLIIMFVCLGAQTAMMAATPQDTAYRPMGDTTGFKAKLAAYTVKLSSLECDILQKKFSEMLNSPALTEGRFYYANTNRIRWEYTSPFSFVFVINNDKLIMNDGEKVNRFDLNSNKVFEEISHFLNAIMKGSITESHAGFSLAYLENAGHYRLDITGLPGNETSYFNSVSVYYLKKDFGIAALKITDRTGDVTHVEFRNIKINQPIADEKFTVR